MEPRDPVSIVVLASGTGSNLKAIHAMIERGKCHAKIAAVVSDRAAAPALDFARDRGIPTEVVPLKKGADRKAWNLELAGRVTEHMGDLVVLAGFMRILDPTFLDHFPDQVINVHPSILPAFRGKDAPSQAIAAGVRLSGCTVHLVNEEVDAGAILAQAAVPVLPTDDPTSLHQRIQVAEHHLLPAVVDWVGRGLLTLGPAPQFATVSGDPPNAIAYPDYS